MKQTSGKQPLSLKHKIALVELVVLVILGCYFFLPKSFSQAMGKDFAPDRVTAVTVQLEGARGKRGEDHTFSLSPADPIYTELIDRLESRKYLPLYTNTTARTTTLDYVVTLTFQQDGADYIFTFCGDRAMDVRGVKTRTVQLKGYEAFQSSLLALLLGQV